MRLVVENLSAERGGGIVFAGLGFDLSDGEALTVTGPNGSGKSTLLRVIAGLLPAAGGEVRIDGAAEDAGVAASCHYLGHLNAMKGPLTVAENLGFWRDFEGPADAQMTVADALDTIGLGEIGHLPYAYLSTGQKRRVAIARLLVDRRPVWLLDEPTAGLDAASVERFAARLAAHRRTGGIVVAATHLPLGLDGARELRMGGTTIDGAAS